MRIIIIFLVFLGLVISCASNPPKQQQNICSIFEQKSSWYRIVSKSEEKWGAPIHVQMAIMSQESAFQNRVKPGRTKLLGVIPWKRKSSSFGYTQAVDATWDWYREDSNKPLASRVNFADAADFTGWYINKTHIINNISKSDAYRQYLAYHEGHGGFKNKSYKGKDWLIEVAIKVQNRANSYQNQLKDCESKFKKKFLGIF